MAQKKKATFQQEYMELEKLQQSGLTYDLVKGAITSQITSLPGGSVKTSEGKIETINIEAPVSSIDEIKNIPLGPVTLGDISNVTRTPKDQDTILYGGFVRDGKAQWKEAVYLLVFKKDDGDAIRISEAVHGAIDDIEADNMISSKVNIETLYDSSPYIEDQVSSLINNGLLGLALILLVLLFFINLRTAIVVSLIIPMAFLITLFILPVIGYTLNILTLFSMILTLGILVDNAIVIAEGINYELDRGKKKKQAILSAMRRLGPAVTAATVTTIIVFIPFASIGGIMGEFMKFIPYTIIIMLAVSYILAITITPFFSYYILKEETKEKRYAREMPGWQKAILIPKAVQTGQKFVDRLVERYKGLMTRIFAKRWRRIVTVVSTVLLMLISFGVFGSQLKFEQFPSDDAELLSVSFDFPTGTPKEDKEEVFEKVLEEAVTLPHFQNFYNFEGSVWITFTVPKDRDDGMTIFEIDDQFNEQLVAVRDSISEEYTFETSPATYGPPESGNDVTVEFLSRDFSKLEKAADDLVEYTQSQEGVDEVENGIRDNELKSVAVQFDQDKLAQSGADPLLASSAINAVFAEQEIGSVSVRTDGISDDVVLLFDQKSRDSVDDVKNLPVTNLQGNVLSLNSIADVKEVSSLFTITRLEGKRVASVGIKLDNSDDAIAFEQKMKDYLTEDKLNEFGLEEEDVSYGGFVVTSAEDYKNLQIVFILAIIFVYLILIYQFNSFGQPLLILLTIPIAMIGVFPGLMAVGSSINMISGLGVIALVGIVVNDAIVLLTTYNRYRKEYPEETKYEILTRTGANRFKPILSTSITTIFGIMPLTIRDPFWAGLGMSIIAGLIFSTIGTLVVLPVIYSMFIRKKKPKKEKVPVPPPIAQ
ncbi:efflux RND transporter permease subunit [Patescibacteria group bacterium]